MSIPDCTLVTACYDLTRFNNNSRKLDDALDKMNSLLETPCYLMIFTDKIFYEKIFNIRNNYGLNNLTFYIIKEIENLNMYKYVDIVKSNREKYHPTKDERTCAESHLICCSKFDFVLDTIFLNPFKTSKFGWIDSNIGVNFSKICIDYKQNMLLNALHNASEKFHIQILNSEDKKYLKTENLKEYYENYRWIVCGCLFITGKEIGIKILNDLNSIVMKHTMLGYGHGEEMFYLEILEKYYDDISRSYGEYNTILNNFSKITTNIHYIYNVIILRYLHNKYYKECIECCEKVISAYDNFVMEINYEMYFNIIFTMYVSYYYIDIKKAKQTANKLLELVEKNTYIKKEFDKNKKYHTEQLNYVM
jgi:hypothetical protein